MNAEYESDRPAKLKSQRYRVFVRNMHICLGCRDGTERKKAQVICDMGMNSEYGCSLKITCTYNYYSKKFDAPKPDINKGHCFDNACQPFETELLFLQEFTSVEHFISELTEYIDRYNNKCIKLN